MSSNGSQEGFTNIENPPQPKDNYEETVQGAFQNNSYVGAPTNNYRRASTSPDTTILEQPTKMSRNPSMNMQDAIHIRRLSTEINSDNLVDDVLDNSDKITKSKEGKKKPVEFNGKYNDVSSSSNIPKEQTGDNPFRRREGSAFKYEDYKKEMYDKVGFE
ncbi:similar to Saccharomyces cerevisiae YFR017C IGD1 Cytoplasmic protein that inhibits Gdb1p glycogen debranching activity [Maudiozyma saulgeensis]|uniref:Similar to Saccharomyces cerevisiae YFR017C IGD1 Cytoplasmic protein that inhibits Gdb1p glycogen debranching activity n=1 Tax=Maudiozyma saulgeensis TaxID=1789683 RepID=A0A1X7QZX5_9SACH|nr:similar to Saccharomyces cerevisiae YFR017C IGD1 Cytoplasmic protein that inhibits Gdb1p glycogen debranching activity [Kazachstania saulgeensis]